MGGQADRAGKAYQLAATFFAEAIQTTGYLVVALVVSLPLALAALGIGGLMALVLHFLVRMARKAGARQTRWTRELVTFLVDTLNNVKPLRAMAKEQAFTNLLADKTAALKKSLRRQVISAEWLKSGNGISGGDLSRHRIFRGDHHLAGADRRAGGGRAAAEQGHERHRQDPAAVPEGVDGRKRIS